MDICRISHMQQFVIIVCIFHWESAVINSILHVHARRHLHNMSPVTSNTNCNNYYFLLYLCLSKHDFSVSFNWTYILASIYEPGDVGTISTSVVSMISTEVKAFKRITQAYFVCICVYQYLVGSILGSIKAQYSCHMFTNHTSLAALSFGMLCTHHKSLASFMLCKIYIWQYYFSGEILTHVQTKRLFSHECQQATNFYMFVNTNLH